MPFLALLLLLPTGPAHPAVEASPVVAVAMGAPDAALPRRHYYAYVCAESEDEVSLVRLGPGGLEEVKTITVGSFPADIEGPHGINVSPDGRYWFVSIAHGQPYGSIHRYETGSDEWDGDVRVGMFPATLDISPTTGLLYVVNADFYGDPVPSTISVVETSTMTEVAQIPTGVMPHGARLGRDGTSLYSVNMMNDELVEVDALSFAIVRRLPLPVPAVHTPAGNGGDHSAHSEPSWVSAPTRDGRLYVPALSGNAIFEIDLAAWKIRRVFTGSFKGPYNLDTSPDGRLLAVTYKKGDAVGFWNLETGEELARIDTQRRLPHGIAITSDGRYTFATVEGVGGEPGLVEVYDNTTLTRIDSLEIGKQAGGIALWKGKS